MLIGIVGPKNSGKDTIADFLCLQYDFHKESFAAPLKEICKQMFLLDNGQLTDHELKETIDERWGMRPREMFQKFGTDIIRTHFGADFWIRHMEMRIILKPRNRVVVSDVRFENEANWVKRNGGILVRVRDTTSLSNNNLDQHSSETEQLGIQEDVLIENNKDAGVNDLYRKLIHQIIPLVNSHTTREYRSQNVVSKVHKGWTPFLDKHVDQLDDIMEHVRKDASKRIVYPFPENILRCLWFFPPEETRLVLLGQDPYIGQEVVQGQEVPQASGLSFSVPKSHHHIPPSLQNIFKELVACFPQYKKPSHGCLLRWAIEEKILLLNASLTVIKGNSNSHEEYWSDFTDQLISFLSETHPGTIFLLMGKFAANKAALIDQRKHKVFTTVHPSPLSASRGFFGCRVFQKINEHLASTSQIPIRWLEDD